MLSFDQKKKLTLYLWNLIYLLIQGITVKIKVEERCK